MNWKEIAKFVSGAAAVEIINHSVLATSDLLPLHFFGYAVSKSSNLIILACWTVVFVMTVYYAWLKKEKKKWYHFFR
jgi:hypothetical protein